MCRRHSRIEPLKQSIKSPHPVDVEVGRRVRLQRNIIGMSQSTLAEALGVSFQQVQKYEKGSNRVGSSRLSQIAQALRVPVSYFFPDHDEKNGSDISSSADLDPMIGFLDTEEGRKLNIAFAKIASQRVRHRIVSLVTALARSEDA